LRLRLGPPIAIVNVGTLETPELLTPGVHCWTASRHPWIAVPDGGPAYAGDYDVDQVWSEEAKARIGAALDQGT